MNRTYVVYLVLMLPFLLSCKVNAQIQQDKSWDFNHTFTTTGDGWTGGDGVYSIPLSDNRSVFIFGDTYLGEVTEDNSRVNSTPAVKNSLVIWDKGKIKTIIGVEQSMKKPQPYFQTADPDSTWFWPGHGYENDDSLTFFLAEFKATGYGVFGFEWTGTSIATIKTDKIGIAQPTITEWQHGTDIHFGMATLVEDDVVYVFGIKAFQVYVAKTKLVADTNWEYWNGKDWTVNSNSSQPLDGVYASEQFSVFKHEGQYVILSQAAMLGKEIFAFTSKSLLKGWSKPIKLFSTTEPVSDSTLITYNALAHPQFTHQDKLLISYCVNSTDFLSIYRDVRRYRPRFIQVPMSALKIKDENNLQTK